MNSVIREVRQCLQDNIDEKVLKTSGHFFKKGENVPVYGVRMYNVGKIAKESFKEIKELPKADVFGLCEELWQSGYLEENVIACEWAYALRKEYTPEDIHVFRHWLQDYVNNWGACDTLCNHTIGTFVEIFPEFISELKEWATSDNRWVRRGAAVTLILPARKGLFFDDILQIATTLLHDKDDLVQKGYGWMLKAASEAYQKEVFDFVVSHKATMPRTALRYAIEKMPQELRKEAMKKE